MAIPCHVNGLRAENGLSERMLATPILMEPRQGVEIFIRAELLTNIHSCVLRGVWPGSRNFSYLTNDVTPNATGGYRGSPSRGFLPSDPTYKST